MQVEPIEIDQISNLDLSLPNKMGAFQIGRFRLTQGKSAGCELVIVDFGKGRAAICPTRGMSLWKAELDSIPCGWNSPVRGPVHPSFVPVADPSGLGWLEGFDELLVRCGLRSFGAPDFDASGRLAHPLHGRIGNLPADNVKFQMIESMDATEQMLVVSGEVRETRFLVYNVRLTVEYRFVFGNPAIHVDDWVTNDGATPTDVQLLYHINFGPPLLGEKAKAIVPANQIVARDGRAAEGLEGWAIYQGPTPGFAEQVYFTEPLADEDGWAFATLVSPEGNRCVTVRFKADSLPYFTLWKNTAVAADGYVTGLEPGTGFPNPYSFEKQCGRTVPLQPGGSQHFKVVLEGLNRPHDIAQMQQALASLQGDEAPKLLEHREGWSSP